MSKKIRMTRLFNYKSGKTFILPIDHGITLGAINGLETYRETVKSATRQGVNTVVSHKGSLKKLLEHDIYGSFSYMMHLSASTTISGSTHHKVLVSQVEEAISYGVDGVSIHVNLGGDQDAKMLQDFGDISGKCEAWGMPLLAMMYAPGGDTNPRTTSHLIKVGQELGADIVKISYQGNMNEVESCILNTGIPVVLAGGSRNENMADVLTKIDNGMKCGIAGVAIGRNIFQSDRIDLYTKLISDIVNGDDSIGNCIKRLKSEGK